MSAAMAVLLAPPFALLISADFGVIASCCISEKELRLYLGQA